MENRQFKLIQKFGTKGYFDNDFTYYLESEYTHIADDYYECNGNHIWHLGDIEKEWENMEC